MRLTKGNDGKLHLFTLCFLFIRNHVQWTMVPISSQG